MKFYIRHFGQIAHVLTCVSHDSLHITGSPYTTTTRRTLPAEEFRLDDTNNVCSVHCKYCQNSNRQSSPASNGSCSFNYRKVVHGGEWGYLQAILKYTGASGFFFCPFCLVRHTYLKKRRTPCTCYSSKIFRQGVLGFVRWWTARIEQVPDACLYGWCKLFPRELNKQTYYYVLMLSVS